MTEDNAKSKLTLSGKSTLTLKNLGDKAHTHEGKKVVQVEVRKKRVINPNAQPAENNVKIDEATAMKLKLIAEAKEHELSLIHISDPRDKRQSRMPSSA